MRTPAPYLDASVLGGYSDNGWKQRTQRLWREVGAGLWVFMSSVLVRDEIEDAPEQVRPDHLTIWTFKLLANG